MMGKTPKNIGSLLSVGAVLVVLATSAAGVARGAAARLITPGKHSRISTPSVAVRPWKFQGVAGNQTVELAVGWTSCDRRPPRFVKTVVERPGRAVITISERPVPANPGSPCLKSRGRSELRVRLGAPISELDLFDGSASPPQLRFSNGSRTY